MASLSTCHLGLWLGWQILASAAFGKFFSNRGISTRLKARLYAAINNLWRGRLERYIIRYSRHRLFGHVCRMPKDNIIRQAHKQDFKGQRKRWVDGVSYVPLAVLREVAPLHPCRSAVNSRSPVSVLIWSLHLFLSSAVI